MGEAVGSYFEQHRSLIETRCAEAIYSAMDQKAEDPLRFIGAMLMGNSPESTPSDATSVTIDFDGGSSPQSDEAAWSMSSWLKSLNMDALIAKALLSAHPAAERSQYAFACVLGQQADETLVRALLSRSLDGLASELSRHLRELQAGRQTLEAEALALSNKFTADGAFSMAFGGIGAFYQGLEGLVGSPSHSIDVGMEAEHCDSVDSKSPFVVDNYGTETTSHIEFMFVKAPENGLQKLGLSVWPQEEKLKLNVKLRDLIRKPRPLSDFTLQLEAINEELKGASTAPVTLAEMIACRLYTGPLFVKYNSTLRKFTGVGLFEDQCASLCLGNPYTTTLHTINSGLIKLSKLTAAQTVYRGIRDGILPDQFWNEDGLKLRCGVDYAFCSTTLNRQIAEEYSNSTHGISTILEIQQGMVDRGADLSWISQASALALRYSHTYSHLIKA